MRPKLWPAFGHWVTSQNPEGGASRSSRYDFPLMRTKLFKTPQSSAESHWTSIISPVCRSLCARSVPAQKIIPATHATRAILFGINVLRNNTDILFLPERNPSMRQCAQGYQKMSRFCEIGGLGMINQPMMQSIQSKF